MLLSGARCLWVVVNRHLLIFLVVVGEMVSTMQISISRTNSRTKIITTTSSTRSTRAMNRICNTCTHTAGTDLRLLMMSPLICTQSVTTSKKTKGTFMHFIATHKAIFILMRTANKHQKQSQISWKRLIMKSPMLNKDTVCLLVRNSVSLQPPVLLSVLLLLCTYVPGLRLKIARNLLLWKVNKKEKLPKKRIVKNQI